MESSDLILPKDEEVLFSNNFLVNFRNSELKSTFVKSTTLPSPGIHIIDMELRNVSIKNKTSVFEILTCWSIGLTKGDIDIDILGGKKAETLTRFALSGCWPQDIYIPTKLTYENYETPMTVKVRFYYDYYKTFFPGEAKETK